MKSPSPPAPLFDAFAAPTERGKAQGQDFRRRFCVGFYGFAALALLFFLAGCSHESANPNTPSQISTKSASGFPRTVTDARGQVVTIAAPPQRIISLAPSNTEILFALGLDSRIAAVTSQCDYPPAAKAKPNVGGYPISSERVLVQNPDLVVTVGSINSKETEALEQARIPVVAVNPKTLADVYAAIKLIGQATGAETPARVAIETMQAEIEVTKKAISVSKNRPKTLILHGASPLYTTNSDSYIAEAITLAGADYAVKVNLPGSVISVEQVLAAPPDVIICSPELAAPISALPGFAQGVPAVKNRRFYTGADLLDRPGPRLPQAIDSLARYLHPECLPAKPAASPAAKEQ